MKKIKCTACGEMVIVCLNGTIFLHYEPKKKPGPAAAPEKCRMSGKKAER